MRSRPSNFGLFCRSLVLTLLLLLPMVAAVAFFANQRQQQRSLIQAATEQQDVPIAAGAQNTHRLLVAVQGEQPEFLLLRVDAPARTVTLCVVPSNAKVMAPAGTTTLAECYLSAGPARAAQLLGDTVGVAPEAYFAATAATYSTFLNSDTAVELDLATLLPAPVCKAMGLDSGAPLTLTVSKAENFLQSARAAAALPALRAQLWALFLHAPSADLPGVVKAARQNSAKTLTDLRAQDLMTMEQTLGYLAVCPDLCIEYDLLPTEEDDTLTAEAIERAKNLLS